MKLLLTTGLLQPSEAHMRPFEGLDIELVRGEFRSQADLITAARDADAILVVAEDFNAEVIANLEKCKVISRFGVGVDTIDIAAATARGIAVCNVPDSNYNEVATHAVALAMSLNRRLAAFDRAVRIGDWNCSSIAADIRRPQVLVFGLIGQGHIGRRVASMASAIGFDVRAHDPGVEDDEMIAAGVRPTPFNELISEADILSLHVPLTASTRLIIGAAELKRMKRGAILINVSRGGLVDENALAEALAQGHLAGAGLDVFEEEPLPPTNKLCKLDNVILTPHMAHASQDALAMTITRAFENAALILRGQPPHHRVN